MIARRTHLAALLLLVTVGVAPCHAREAAEKVSFNRDIRPIFSDTCFKCHGPDSAARKADLRLDTEAGAFGEHEGFVPFKPGDPAASEAYQRIVSDDPDEMMPPPDSGLAITSEQKRLIRRWIEEGAAFEKHWALIPPTRHTPQKGAKPLFHRNPIDRFILARLEQEDLNPSPEADRATLIRRVTLDLTGLPPTPGEVDAFLADESPDAYEKLVDRLLQSPRYGEHVARAWLDASRFADTNGYQVDTHRDMWLWREWVIGAFNRNLPYDRFTLEQIAGDLLPDATTEQKIASGFNRNHRINGEGGIIPEEFLVEYIVDRVDTTGTVWLGLTLGCARCHDHKFDPITQKEFYQLYAFFNTVPENGVDGLTGPSAPFLKVPTAKQQARIAAIDGELATLNTTAGETEAVLVAAQAQWEQTQATAALPPPSTEALAAHFTLDGPAAAGASTPWTFKDGEPAFAASPFGQAAEFDGKRFIDGGDVGRFEYNQPFSFGAWVYTHADTSGAAIARMNEAASYQGYNLFVSAGTVIIQIISHWPENAVMLTTPPVLKAEQWHHVFTTYDGSGTAAGIKLYVDGQPVQGNPGTTTLTGSIATEVPLTIGTRSPGSRFKGRVDEVRLYARLLPPEEVSALSTQHLLASILAIPAAQRTPDQGKTLTDYYKANHAPAEYRQTRQKIDALTVEKTGLDKALPTTMVMQEMDKPRETFVLTRGEYDKKAEPVTAAVPAALPPLAPGEPLNRLGLARWLVSAENPLTARVAVNRYWQSFFGTGLVPAAENFGSQAEWPSHPELLDWLATEFVRGGWDIKAMHRLIATSATYRQSSKVTPEVLERDPENRLLARGPRFRMPAEMLRDQALALSGLYAEKLGGPSVKPYQPPKIWEELTSGGFSASEYVQDKGENLYRRGMYTYWKRTIPPPLMATFDAPSREICIIRRGRTNTPLQALALMNETAFVESARHLAARMIREGGSTPESRIAHGFRLATARRPTESETPILAGALARRLAQFRADPSAAEKLITVGDSPRDATLDPAEHAAYTALANLILNLDETVTKE